MKRVFISLLTVLSCLSVSAQDVLLDSTTVNVSILTDSVDIPWDVSWGPDHNLWITDGPRIKKIDPQTGAIKTIWTSPRMIGGLPTGNGLGLTFHPDFFNNPQVYLAMDTAAYYNNGGLIKVYCYDYSFTEDTLTNETLILEYAHLGEHSGGRMITTQDGKIMITTSDYHYQLPDNSLEGRTLRFNPDGSVPADNPFNNYTYSLGHRNPQGLLQTPNGKIYVSEHGMFGHEQDELNLIVPGGNYGWPAFDGFDCGFLVPDSCASPTFVSIKPMDGGAHPPTGIDYYNHEAIPEFKQSIIEATLAGQLIYFALNPIGDSLINKTVFFPGESRRMRDICTSPSGEVYFISDDRENLIQSLPSTSDAKIRRLKNKNYDHCIPTSAVVQHTLCSGDSVLIEGVAYKTARNVTETLVNAAGCDSLVIHVIENTSPINTTVTINQNTLTAQETNANYQWLSCPDMTEVTDSASQSFSSEVAGSFAVKVSKDGCQDTSACETILITSLNEIDANKSNAPFPNPSKGLLQFSEAVNYEIYDTNGKLIVADFGSKVNVQTLDSGIYFVKTNSTIYKWVLKR